jgi:hypothetical protein
MYGCEYWCVQLGVKGRIITSVIFVCYGENLVIMKHSQRTYVMN